MNLSWVTLRRIAVGAVIWGWFWIVHAQSDAPVYFLIECVREPPAGTPSSVLPLSEPEDIAHARWLIAEDMIHKYNRDGFPAGARPIAVMRVAEGPDAINRDYTAPGFPAWQWHVSEVVGFEEVGGAYVEFGRPPWVEQVPHELWYDAPLGFPEYTVSRELGPTPLFLAVEEDAGRLWFYWSGTGTNEVYTLESAESPVSTDWTVVVTGLTPAKRNLWVMLHPPGPPRYYRVLAEPQRP